MTSIPVKQQEVLYKIYNYLNTNKKHIYRAHQWVKFGEDLHNAPSGYMSDNKENPFTAYDFRFTTKRDTLYAIVMEWGEKNSSSLH